MSDELREDGKQGAGGMDVPVVEHSVSAMLDHHAKKKEKKKRVQT